MMALLRGTDTLDTSGHALSPCRIWNLDTDNLLSKDPLRGTQSEMGHCRECRW